MIVPVVVLAVQTGLDVDAARRLGDYGELDDAGVARALEQVHVQRWGRFDPPGHLTRIEALAAIIDDGEAPHLLWQPTARNEPGILDELFGVWPESACELVDWDGSARALLSVRALVRERVLPVGFEAGSPCALTHHAAPGPATDPAFTEQNELECLRLMGGLSAEEGAPSVVERVLARHRLWLRWQYCRGRMGRSQAERAAAVMETPGTDLAENTD